jgi:L-fucose mutarotase
MLKNVPKILSPELLKVLCEMGHSDVIVLGDGNFPGDRFAREGNCKLIRCDGHGVPELLDAILTMIPLDTYVEHPIHLMELSKCDKGMAVPIWDEYRKIIAAHDPRGDKAIGTYERFEFYEQTKKSYCIVQTGEAAVYANVAIQKGVIK